MADDLSKSSYIPTIFLRRAELRALRELPEHAKDALTPIFCLKPWATTKYLEQSIHKVIDVYGENRRFFLDIDPFYEVPEETKRPSQDEFAELIDDELGSKNWIDFLANYENASPCIQVDRGTPELVYTQIQEFTQMGRPFIARLSHGGTTGKDWREIVNAICETEHTNFGFVVDMEWSQDLLTRSIWADALIKQITQRRGGSIPICVCGSSFPNSFSEYGSEGAAEILERGVFDSLARNNSQARLIYGDWASSRPPGESIPIKNEIPPRVDLPGTSSWSIFRYRSDDGGFIEACKRAVASADFPEEFDVWGTYALKETAAASADDKGYNIISNREISAAVRINLHLFRQLNYGNEVAQIDTDDDFIE